MQIYTFFFLQHFLQQFLSGEEEKNEVWSRLQSKSQACTSLENELKKQKSR